jgi:tetratricopeptide (TPR) repeat protein
MVQQIIELTCPGCGARVSTGMSICEWCHKPIVITTFNSVADMPLSEVNKYANSYKKELVKNPDDKTLNTSIAMCYFKLKMYDKAASSFEKAIEDNFDNSETYFYAAVNLLKGKKAFLAQRPDINKIEEYINAANMIEPKGMYHYFLAYIKYDFFERKYLNTSPTYEQCLVNAEQMGISQYDKEMMFDLLGVGQPTGF